MKDTHTPLLSRSECACISPQRKQAPMGYGWSKVADQIGSFRNVRSRVSDSPHLREEMRGYLADVGITEG